ncbi:Ig-like domain-containing protein [uncultured Methanobacterium sp.]|uniref:Ig-like domain-containing protein n=1 Tax=uncultured Methanobacterium sp. TaxID=176306 RepID=UPI002AA6D285|nr:Ig-like domain-containing protein [uncultured Methanobacterium sp.]
MNKVPKKLILIFLVLLFGLVLVGAASAADDSPVVTAVDPANCATDVDQNQEITVTFNEDVQPGSNYNGIAVHSSSGQGYSITKVLEGNELTIKGNVKWTAGTTFEILIPKNAVRNKEGDQNENLFTSSFTASSGPSVVSFDPTDGTSNVQTNKQIVVTFSEDIQPGTNYQGITVRNATTGQGYSLTKSIVGNQLFLSGKWTRGTTFEILIPKNAVSDLDGNGNAYINTSKFTASQVSFDPANGAADVDQNKQITATFNYLLTAGPNFNSITVYTISGQGYTITKTIVGNKLLITGKWTPGTTFEILIPTNAILDPFGNPNSVAYTSTFTASSGPSVVSFDPVNGATNVARNKQIVITFSEDIQAGTNYHSITVRNATTGQGYSITKSITGNQLFLTGNWTPGTTFEIVIPKNAIKDTDGNSNANIYTSTFTVATS